MRASQTVNPEDGLTPKLIQVLSQVNLKRLILDGVVIGSADVNYPSEPETEVVQFSNAANPAQTRRLSVRQKAQFT